MSNGDTNFLNSPALSSLMGTVGNYYLGKEGIEGAYETGRLGQEMSGELAQDLSARSEFKPFTVTGSTGTAVTRPDGSLDLRANPEQAGLQKTLLQDATNMFNRLKYDTQGVQRRADEIYEDIRATQTPEEERQRLAMEERLLGQGRLGLQSSMFGGANPEMFALEKARQEAMNQAALTARDVASQERLADYTLASGLMGQSYLPENQMIKLLQAGISPKQLAQNAQTQGTALYGQAQRSGLESFLQGAELANRLQLQQQEAMMNAFMPQPPSMEDILRAQALGIDASTLGGDEGLFAALGLGDARTPDWIRNIGDGALRWLGIGQDEPTEDDAVSQVIADPTQYDNFA